MDQQRKNEILATLSEYNGMVQNLETMSLIEEFLLQHTIHGTDAKAMSRCLHWLEGMSQGMKARRDELKSKLPTTDMNIQMAGPEEPPKPEEPVAPVPETPAAADSKVGAMEFQKGEPVLG